MWILLALLTAVLTAAREGLVKKAMGASDDLVVVFVLAGATALALAPVAGLQSASASAPPDGRFWIALGVSGSLNAVATLLLVRAVHLSDLSLVSPLKSFTPAFMLLTAPVVLGEVPGLLGLAGVVAIVAGAYLLATSAGERTGGLEPVRALLRDRGARLMLTVAFLYSVSSVVDKVGVLHSTPIVWGASLNAVVALAMLPLALHRRGAGGAGALRIGNGWMLLAAGAANALAVAAQMTALTLTLAAYVIAIKRTSVLFGVGIGHVFFGERGLRPRLAGAAVMLLGIVLLTLT